MELINFSFFEISGWGIDLDYCDIEWFALETNWDHSVIFFFILSFLRLHPSTAFWTLSLVKQQFKPYLEQLMDSELRKEYNKAVCYHPVYLTYM